MTPELPSLDDALTAAKIAESNSNSAHNVVIGDQITAVNIQTQLDAANAKTTDDTQTALMSDYAYRSALETTAAVIQGLLAGLPTPPPSDTVPV